MNKDYEMEELADAAVGELRNFIDEEKQLIRGEHDLISKLQSWDYIVAHLDERLPANMTNLHKLNEDVAKKLIEIRDLIESGTLSDLRILKEEEQILQQLPKDVEHRDWMAVRKNADSEAQEEEQAVRLEKRELKDLHSKFIELMKLMKRSKLISAIEEDLTIPKEKEEYEKLEEHYFIQLYKFARAYERIFRHLWRKELILYKKTKKYIKKIK
jgi:hypothetical protein